MTNTPMSEREKALLGAVRAFIANTKAFYGDQVEIPRLESALHAYDPKPEPVPVIPAWPELTNQQRDEIRQSTEGSPVVTYNAIRRITSKAPTE